MQVRRIVNNDYSFGRGKLDFADGIEACLQKCRTKLSQLKGEWFLDQRDGVAWGDCLGHKVDKPKLASIIKNTLVKVPGVVAISALSVDVDGRYAYVIAKIETDFGLASLNQSLNVLEILSNDQTN